MAKTKVYLAEKTALNNHVNNSNVHVTSAEKTKIANALTSDSVVPATDASLTKTIATIGGKAIKAPEGGGATGHKLTVLNGYFLGFGGGATTSTLFIVFADGHIEVGSLFQSPWNPWGAGYDSWTKLEFEGVVAVAYSHTTAYERLIFYPLPFSTYDGASTAYLPCTEPITSDTTITVSPGCFLSGTPIRLADGTDKPIEEITYNDELLVWDFDNGCHATAKPAWIKVAENIDYAFVNEYASGRKLHTTGESATGWGHRHYDITRNEFRYTPTTVGDRVMTLDGEDEHISCRKIFGDFQFYNLITERHFNCYAEGVLTSCSLNNLYPIVGMKYVKDGRAIRAAEEFPNAGDFYDKLRLGEVGWSVEAVNKYVNSLKGRMAK